MEQDIQKLAKSIVNYSCKIQKKENPQEVIDTDVEVVDEEKKED